MDACPDCGAENSDRASHCTLCLRPLGVAADGPSMESGYASGPPPAESGYPLGPPPVDNAYHGGPPPIEEGHPPAPAAMGYAMDSVPAYADAGYAAAPAAPVVSPPVGRSAPATQPTQGISITRAATAMFDDSAWLFKVLLGAFLTVIPFGWPVLVGYLVEYVGEVADGRDRLPSFGGVEEMWSYFGRGLLVTVMGVVLAIPAMWAWFWMTGAALRASLGGSGGYSSSLVAAMGLSLIAYLAAISMYYAAGLVDYAAGGEFASFLPWRVAGMVFSNPSFFGVWALAGGIMVAAGGVSSLLSRFAQAGPVGLSCLSGLVLVYGFGSFVRVYAMIVCTHLFGQWSMRVYGLTAVPSARPPGALL